MTECLVRPSTMERREALPSVREPSRNRAHTRVLVEQVADSKPAPDSEQRPQKTLHGPDSGRQSHTTTHRENQPGPALDTLTVPEHEVDDSSEASSLTSQHTDEDRGPGDESIAVDCHTNPSEVIVKGKNVKQIRVKFPPHPPASEEGPRARSGRSRLRRSTSGTSVRDSGSDTQAPEDEKLPYPFEETSLPAISETPGMVPQPGSTFVNLGRQESTISLHSYETSNNQQTLNPGSSRLNAIDWDLKYKHDILAGLEYFERKGTEINDVRSRLQQQLDQLRLKNIELENLVNQLRKEKLIMSNENDELKIQMDQSEKENMILREQAQSQWQDRVTLEERFMELQRDSSKEISSLKTRIVEIDRELHALKTAKNLENKAQHMMEHSKSPTRDAMKHGDSRRLSDDNFELLHKISCLQEDIKKLTREKDVFSDTNNKLRQDMDDVKSCLKDKQQELDSQYKRFLSLKKSFNDLKEENDLMKGQSRGRTFGQQVNQREQANTTWPAANPTPSVPQRKNSINTVEMESVSYIDFPTRPSNGAPSFKHVAPGAHSRPTKPSKSTSHKRNKSENLADNLPPVPNQGR